MGKCDKCGKQYDERGMVSLTIREGQPSQNLCIDCYNQFAVKLLGIKDFKDFIPEVKYKDCTGEPHDFKIYKMINPMGIEWKAEEFFGVGKIGYSFAVNQEFDTDPQEAIATLNEKVRKGLSQKFVKKETFQGQELLSFQSNVAEGRIESDDKGSNKMPKFIIDGKEYTYEQFSEMLLVCEGWNFRLEIKESID